MKSCDYCGKENDDGSAFCAGCGTGFPPSEPQPEPPISVPPLPPYAPPPPPFPRALTGGAATIVLLVYFGAQVAGGVVAGFFGGLVSGLRGDFPGHNYQDTMQAIMPLTVFVVMAFGWAAMVVVAKTSQFQFNDVSPTGPAWVRGSWREITKGLGLGILVALLWILLSSTLGRQQSEEESSPMTRMAMTPGFGQIVWVITAILLAPPVEELLFRGILYGGYRKSFGPSVAATLTTVIFVLLHFTELIHLPLAVFALGGLALAALWRRLQSSAIGPAIAVHIGYNSVIALAAVFST